MFFTALHGEPATGFSFTPTSEFAQASPWARDVATGGGSGEQAWRAEWRDGDIHLFRRKADGGESPAGTIESGSPPHRFSWAELKGTPWLFFGTTARGGQVVFVYRQLSNRWSKVGDFHGLELRHPRFDRATARLIMGEIEFRADGRSERIVDSLPPGATPYMEWFLDGGDVMALTSDQVLWATSNRGSEWRRIAVPGLPGTGYPRAEIVKTDDDSLALAVYGNDSGKVIRYRAGAWQEIAAIPRYGTRSGAVILGERLIVLASQYNMRSDRHWVVRRVYSNRTMVESELRMMW